MDLDPQSILAMSGLALYLAIFLLPFVQEDVAVVAAATASLSGAAPTAALFLVILAGLTCSDVWKYWLGYFARKHRWAHKFAERKGVSVAGDLVRSELLKTLFAARYIPGTRIPTYVACGFFKVPYGRFVMWVIFTAFTYVTVMFTLFHTVGEIWGEQAKFILPAIAVCLLVSYILFRWLTHRKGQHGPMTPLTEERDRPLYGMPGFEGTPYEGEQRRKRRR
ncbi:MAG: VTT domain-containing protein [Parvularculaceae bacterium]|jgi:membrane protein DedA with SNARE-associated domain|nr:VTT domain-containing protein [Parvularculaceae bacterium]